jgi:hypothetical protein
MPNQEIMREWVRRLRSGDYEQGQGFLSKDDTHCCLGVLCEIAVERGVIPPPRVVTASDEVYPYASIPITSTLPMDIRPVKVFEDSAQMPSSNVYQWAGINPGRNIIIDNSLGMFMDDGSLYARKLAEMNDEGKSFAEIADVIEANWIDPEPAAVEPPVVEPAETATPPAPAVTVPDSPAGIAEATIVVPDTPADITKELTYA